jgi:hypothetical protein
MRAKTSNTHTSTVGHLFFLCDFSPRLNLSRAEHVACNGRAHAARGIEKHMHSCMSGSFLSLRVGKRHSHHGGTYLHRLASSPPHLLKYHTRTDGVRLFVCIADKNGVCEQLTTVWWCITGSSGVRSHHRTRAHHGTRCCTQAASVRSNGAAANQPHEVHGKSELRLLREQQLGSLRSPHAPMSTAQHSNATSTHLDHATVSTLARVA